MYTQVINFIQKRTAISHEELEQSLSYTEFKKFRKGDYLIRIGEYCEFVGFLNKGLLVTTYVDSNGMEKASEFKLENCFFTYTEGLAKETPSHKNIIALEDCETLLINKKNLNSLFNQYPNFAKLFNTLLTDEIRQLLLKEQEVKAQSLEQRYLALEQKYRDAFLRIPVKYMAGYLGIEVQSLSRLRRRLAQKRM